MNLFEELSQRGLIAQLTHEEEIKKLLNENKITFYVGFDPTADSLHVGHLLQMIVMSHMQKAGHTPIALIGGGTAMIGDPSGRTDMRTMMTQEQINYNGERFKAQMSNVIDFSDNKAIMDNNANWLLGLNYVEFLREIGVHFSVNRMLTAECFKSRLEKGLSFIEFNYMLMQSYDFLQLCRKYNCTMQLGGDDQWSNIIGGVELIRRVLFKPAYGTTFNLLTNSEGKKMGKTQSGAVWLDPDKFTPFDFYQYFRNVSDSDVIKFLKMLTFIPLEEIKEFEELKDKEINKAKERLAFEVTKIVHGGEEANKAQAGAKALFISGVDTDNMPTTNVSEDELNILDILVKTGLASSKTDARRLITQGGVLLNDKKVSEIITLTKQDFDRNQAIIKKGKKNYHKLILNPV